MADVLQNKSNMSYLRSLRQTFLKDELYTSYLKQSDSRTSLKNRMYYHKSDMSNHQLQMVKVNGTNVEQGLRMAGMKPKYLDLKQDIEMS